MTEVTFKRDKNNLLRGFKSQGHSGYADRGEDIVCAGISALVINTINSIDNLTDMSVTPYIDRISGVIECQLEAYMDHDVQLLLQSLCLGLQEIENNYGNEYIKIIFEEV